MQLGTRQGGQEYALIVEVLRRSSAARAALDLMNNAEVSATPSRAHPRLCHTAKGREAAPNRVRRTLQQPSGA